MGRRPVDRRACHGSRRDGGYGGRHHDERSDQAPAARRATRTDRNHMTQLIAEQVLVVLHVPGKPECPERSSSVDQEVSDTPSDQEPNDVVVKRPPRLVARRHGVFDQTHRVVDHGGCDRHRSTVLIASDRESYLGPRDARADVVQPGLQVGLGEPVPLATQDVGEVLGGALRVAHHLALDAGGGSSSEVRPQRLATVSAKVGRMVRREEQYPSAKALAGQDPQRALAEVRVKSLPGRRSRQSHVFPWGLHEESDQRGEATRPPHGRRDQTCHGSRTNRVGMEWQRTGSRDPLAAVPDPAV
jgi:hypothetical protein